jgi:hypothetical protein
MVVSLCRHGATPRRARSSNARLSDGVSTIPREPAREHDRAAHFAVVGARRPAGTETFAVFVCADTLTMSMSCRAQMAAADGEQWFTVLEPDVDVTAVLRRLNE